MKLKLPDNTELILDNNLFLVEKKEIIKTVLDDWEDYFRQTWKKSKTKVCLDILAQYLISHKEDPYIEDKTVLSRRKIKEMRKGSKRYITFSSLPLDDKLKFGIIDFDDDDKTE